MTNSTRTTKDKLFNCKMTAEQWAMLTELATLADMSRGQVLRILITRAFDMKCKGIPCCATGKSCPMPQLHTDLPTNGKQETRQL